MERTDENHTATPLELFFDLVFVFGLTQVTAYMAHENSWLGLVQGALVMALLWWAWVGYSWLTNVVRADEGEIRVILMVAMAVMFIVALAIPEAFHDLPGGLDGPYVLVAAYVAFRLNHLALFWAFARNDPALRRQLLKFAPTLVLSTVLLLVAAGTEDPYVRAGLWAVALAGEYIGTALGGSTGWRLSSVGHFSERHALMVIIALGESIVAIGIGAEELPISWPIVAASALGLALASGLWWIYFDITSLHAEHALAKAPDDGTRTAMARDAYSILHVLMMIGIVLLALGLKKLLGYVGDPEYHSLSDPLKDVGLAALFGGVILYVVGHIAFKARTVKAFSRPRAILVVLLAVAWVLLAHQAALLQLTAIVVLVWALVAYETRHYAEQRNEIRHGHHEAGAHLPDAGE